eukprot:TRINITY_DN2875_c5_g1_i1.p1 TRINITY_DN2875_c5_g1~~TRINITY_DN2875_c5_g1_i1.p1  ORF type:complete len:226 (-),score=102.01 TRINITY_DN2875_c5_g1_i1:81-758(-)
MSERKITTRWPAMESNPEVINKFANNLGLSENWTFADVFGLDDELLDMIAQPVLAVILLFPSKAKIPVDESKRKETNVFFLRQIRELDDACGTIAMIHAIINNFNSLGITQGPLRDYYNRTNSLSIEERGFELAADNNIAGLHGQFSQQGQTETVPEGKSSGHHFVCFVEENGNLFELDGCKPFPIFHGPINHSLLKSAAKIIQDCYMRDPTLLDFSIIALAPNQ